MTTTQLDYALQEADVVALAMYRLEKMPGIRGRLLRRSFVYFAGFALLAAGQWAISGFTPIVLFFLVLALTLPIAYPVLTRWQVQRAARKVFRDHEQVRQGATAVAHGLRAEPDGLAEIATAGEAKVIWSYVDDIGETSTHVFISLKHIPGIVIPRDGVSTEDLAAFLDTCRERHRQAIEERKADQE